MNTTRHVTTRLFGPTVLILGGLCLALGLGATTVQADEVDDRIARVNELLKDIPTVVAERRADQAVLTGWTRNKDEENIVEDVLKEVEDVLDMTGEDIADHDQMVEIDVAIVVVSDQVSTSVGFDFLQLVTLQFNHFTAYHDLLAKPGLEGPNDFTSSEMSVGTHHGYLFNAAVDYNVNIANATDQLVNIVARPHLTTLNGEKAEFLAGGEIVFKVSGLNSGRIQPYPFGIQLAVTPTILRTLGPDGRPQVLLDVDAQRLSVLGVQLMTAAGLDDAIFDKTQVKSKALLPMDETLVLSGIYVKEEREQTSGVPLLRSIPFIKYFFSNQTKVNDVLSTIVFITPRTPGIVDQANQRALDAFIERRNRYLDAREQGGEVLEKFKQDYHDWYKPQNNRYATHVFLTNNSQIYRELRGEDLRTERIRRDIMTVESAHEAD